MRIINQKGNEIINFDRITEIVASGNEIVITDNIYKNYGETIGIYKTEKRANEVLEEIIENIQYKSFVEINTDGITSEVAGEIYRMPKE